MARIQLRLLTQDMHSIVRISELIGEAEAELFTLQEDYLTDHISPEAIARLAHASSLDKLFAALSKDPQMFRGKFLIADGLLWWVEKNCDCIFIPEQLITPRKAIFLQHH